MQKTAISCACRFGPPFDRPLPRLILTLALAIAATATVGPALAQPATQPASPTTTTQPAAHPPLTQFLDAVAGMKDQPLVKPSEAAARVKVMEAMYQGAKEGKWVTMG